MALLVQYWASTTQETFLEFIPELLHCFFERVDENFGLKGSEFMRKRMSKLPFQFFEFPKQYVDIYATLISILCSNLTQPYNAQRLFKWTEEKFCQVYLQIHETLQKTPMFTMIIDPEMPQFLQDLLEPKIKHLSFIKLQKPAKLEMINELFPQPFPSSTIVLTAPYSQTLQNFIQVKYATSKGQNPDQINVIKSHFIVKKKIDEKALEVHIYRSPNSMDSESNRQKIEEFRKSQSTEAFEVAGGFCVLENQLVQVSYINWLWVLDSAYYNEWTAVNDYGLVEFQPSLQRQMQYDAAQQEIDEKLMQKQFLGLAERESINMARGWNPKEIQRMEAIKPMKSFTIKLGDQILDVPTDFDTFYHHHYCLKLVRQAQKQLLLKEQIAMAKTLTPKIKMQLSFEEFLNNARNYVYNPFYDQNTDQIIKTEIINRDLQKVYQKKITQLNGVKVDIQEMIDKVDSYQYNGVENQPIFHPETGKVGEMEEIQDFEEEFYQTLKRETKISVFNYTIIRNSVIAKWQSCQRFPLVPLQISQFVGLSYQHVCQFIKLLEKQHLINYDVVEEMQMGPQCFYQGHDEIQTVTMTGTKQQQDTNHIILNRVNAVVNQEIDYESICNELKNDPSLKMANAVIGRFEKE
uniref:Uncharacterized protein n=1 Tax=Trepomonas sp. PC1 TaxID=1076344 RepID=A0A146KJH0_9EUKA|eukprot:JAP95994.1 Hypothetical protein TPC1_10820 [Trepomonas sp. PC1]